jgi:hypothetical protein
MGMTKTVRTKREKPYSKPTLTTYGTIRELTKNVGFNGQLDGGLGSRKTMM